MGNGGGGGGLGGDGGEGGGLGGSGDGGGGGLGEGGGSTHLRRRDSATVADKARRRKVARVLVREVLPRRAVAVPL